MQTLFFSLFISSLDLSVSEEAALKDTAAVRGESLILLPMETQSTKTSVFTVAPVIFLHTPNLRAPIFVEIQLLGLCDALFVFMYLFIFL